MTTTAPEELASSVRTETAPISVGDPGTLRERKKQRTWQQLHSVAMELVLERGLVGVTVEEICAAADVSPRTFFNYFPSKAAAAVGLVPPVVRPEVLESFHSRAGDAGIVRDLCRVVAETIGLPSDRERMKQLVEQRPELVPTMHAWMSEVREQIVAAVAERIGDQTAQLAVALVMSAFMVNVHVPSITSRDDLTERLASTVDAMVKLAAL